MRIRLLLFVCVACMSLVASSTGYAVVVAEYLFDDGLGGGTDQSSDTDTNTTAGTYTAAYFNNPTPRPFGVADFVNNPNQPGFRFRDIGDGPEDPRDNFVFTSSFDRDSDPSLADALNTVDFDIQTHFQQFDLTIPAGVTLSLDNITFDWGVAEAVNSNGAEPFLDLVSSATGSTILGSGSAEDFNDPDFFEITPGSSGIISADDPIDPSDGTIMNDGFLLPYDFDLSSQAGLQNLTDTTVTFIFALDENLNKESDNRRHAIDNVILNGTFAGGPTDDYDGDGDFDADDLATWQASYGSTVTVGDGADGDDSGVIDGGDFLFWQESFDGTPQVSSVPEPSGLLLTFIGSCLLGSGRKHRSRH